MSKFGRRKLSVLDFTSRLVDSTENLELIQIKLDNLADSMNYMSVAQAVLIVIALLILLCALRCVWALNNLIGRLDSGSKSKSSSSGCSKFVNNAKMQKDSHTDPPKTTNYYQLPIRSTEDQKRRCTPNPTVTATQGQGKTSQGCRSPAPPIPTPNNQLLGTAHTSASGSPRQQSKLTEFGSRKAMVA